MMVLFFFVLAGALPVYASPLDPPYEYNPDAYCQSDEHPNHMPVSKNMVIFTTDKWSYIVPESIFGIYGVYFTYPNGCITPSFICDQLRKNSVAENDIPSIVTGFKLDAYQHHTDYCKKHGLKKDAQIF